MPTRNVVLSDHFDRLIEEGVASGRYANASEMVREGLRLIEERDRLAREKLGRLRAAVQVGIDEIERGEGILLSSSEEITAFVQEIADEVEAELEQEATGT